MFRATTLNGLMGLTKAHWAEARATITSLLSAGNPTIRDDENLILEICSHKVILSTANYAEKKTEKDLLKSIL